MSYALRYADTGEYVSARRYPDETALERASKRLVRAKGRTIEGWWLNDAGVPKVKVLHQPHSAGRGA